MNKKRICGIIFTLILLLAICLLGVCIILHSPANKKALSFYYRVVERDSLKESAAMFLVENLKYHSSHKTIKSNSEEWEKWREETDNIIKGLLGKYDYDKIPKDTIRKIQILRDSILTKHPIEEITINKNIIPDEKLITTKFLIDHIENAFRVWEKSKFAKNISFDDFKEYILPYRSLSTYGFIENGKRLDTVFSSMLELDSAHNISDAIKRYNRLITNLRSINGKNRRKTDAGLYDLYVHNAHLCTDIAVYGCNIMRACGLPVVVENVIGYRNLAGKHFHCSVYDADSCKWYPFNAESSLPGHFNFEQPKCLNVYRNMFSAQKETPYFLKGENEPLPAALSNPCIKDVTAVYKDVYKIELPFEEQTDNKIAYLATFNVNQGLLPVTWGTIDKATKSIVFEKTLPYILYFPVYYTNEGFKTFGEPFYVKTDDGETRVVNILQNNKNDEKEDVILTRKFPQKRKMKQVSRNLIGGQFIASNNSNFKDYKVLYTIKEAPLPQLKEYKFKQAGAYKYYRFQAPKEAPHANISWLEWLSEPAYKYLNTDTASRVHILSPADTLTRKTKKIKLLDRNKKRMTWAKEYDKNMTTSPGAYRNITLSLDEPQIVTGVNIAPLNADNGIKGGNTYKLYYWNNGWQYIATQTAKYEYLQFENITAGKLYWLKNITEGKEELPFIIEDGKQKFIYSDIIIEKGKEP